MKTLPDAVLSLMHECTGLLWMALASAATGEETELARALCVEIVEMCERVRLLKREVARLPRTSDAPTVARLDVTNRVCGACLLLVGRAGVATVVAQLATRAGASYADESNDLELFSEVLHGAERALQARADETALVAVRLRSLWRTLS